MSAMVTERTDDPGRLFTVDDLDATPDDGRRYEIVDGVLLVTPAPVRRHQRMLIRLATRLIGACPPELEVFAGPLDVVLSPIRVFEPDVVVVPAGREERRVVETPLLVVEVRSPSTALIDRNVKHVAYAEAGIPSYWIADPDAPSLTVFELGADGGYVEVAHGVDAETVRVARPFPVEVVPQALVAT